MHHRFPRPGNRLLWKDRDRRCLIPVWLMLPIAVAAVLAIFLTTTRGRRLARVAGRVGFDRSRVPSADREFLFEACGRDAAEMRRRLDEEKVRYPGFDEAQLYRRAIRTELRGRVSDGSDA